MIGIAVTPQHRLSGVARGLIAVAVGETGAAGYNRLCLYTDGHGLGSLTFYHRLVSVVPDWFSDSTAKAIPSLQRLLSKR